MTLVHPSERIRAMRQGPKGEIYQTLALTSESLPSDAKLQERGVLRPLLREYWLRDEDGNPLKLRHDRVNDVDRDGALRPATITILQIDRNVEVEGLDLSTARACGYKTVGGARDAWLEKHPRSSLCHVVYFALGDVRDLPVFLAWTGRGSDYTMSPSRAMDEAEALTAEQMSALASVNRQKDEARRARTSATLASETASQRLLRIERYIEHIRVTLGESAARYLEKEVRQEYRIIEQRLRRAEGRTKE